MARKKQNESFRDKCSSMFAPHFEILYKLMTALSSRYGITLPAEFWIATTLTIYAVYMHFFGYSDTELLFFVSLAILSLLFANSGLIFNFIKKIRESVPETTLFLSDIENKEINEVQRFLREYRGLSSREIKLLLKSKFRSFPSIHMSILKYQKITGEILEDVIANDLDKNINSEILGKYIYYVRDDVSNATVDQICSQYKEKEITKSLFVSFPSHFRKIPVYSYLSKFRISIRDWFNYGYGDGAVAIPALIIAIFSVLTYYTPLLVTVIVKVDVIGIIINLLNLGMGFFIIFGFIFIIFKLIILGILRFFKWGLFIFAPTSFNV
jgi:hypothetical protein